MLFTQHYHNRLINDFSRALQDVITVLSFTVNIMLLRIVFTCRRREIGSYRFVIASFAISDLIYTSVHWLVYPIPEMYGNAFLLSGHGLFGTRLGASIYSSVYTQATPILVAHFLYRTLSIRRPSSLSQPSRFFSAMLVATLSLNLFGFFIFYYLFRPDEESLAVLAPLFSGNSSSPVIHHSNSATEHIQALYWSDDSFSRPRWSALIGAALVATVIGTAYTIITLSSHLINKYLKEHAALSTRTASIHRQLYRSLLCQALYPLITSYLPSGGSIILPVFGITFHWVSITSPPLCVSHPLFDALILIFCMREYRSMFLRSNGLSKFVHQQHKQTTTVATTKDQFSLREL